MATLDDILNEIRPNVPKASVLSIRRALRTALRRFCTESQAWRTDVNNYSLTAGTIEHDLSAELPTGAGIYAFSDAPTQVSDGKPIHLSSPQELNRILPNWRNTTGTVSYCYLVSPTTVAFIKAGSSSIAVDMNLVLMPLQNSTAIDDDFLENYWEALASGAIAGLLSMPGQEWSNPNLAQTYAATFASLIEDARIRVNQNKRPQSTGMTYGGI
jgi:hypothetical protein